MLPEPDGNNFANAGNPLAPVPGQAPVPPPSSGVQPCAGAVRHGRAPLPPALTRPPNGMLLLKALGRRWLLGTCLGLLLAALAGGGTFYFLPPPKHTVRTLIHVPPQRGVVFKHAVPGGDLSNHQRTQVVMLKSRLVLNSALRDPKVAKLSVVREQIEPVEWLEKEIQADFSVAPEVLRVVMNGDKPDQLVVLVDAIVQAYRREIVENEQNQRRERLSMLRALREKYEGQLRERKQVQKDIIQNAGGSKDAVARALLLSFEQQTLAMTQQKLWETKLKLMDARLERDLQQQLRDNKAPEPDIPDKVVSEHLDAHPAVAKLLAEVEQLKDDLEKERAKFARPEVAEKFDSVQTKNRKLKVLQARLAEQRNIQRPKILAQLRDKVRAWTGRDSGSLQGQIIGLENTEKVLLAEVERLRNRVQELTKNGGKLDDFQDYVSQLEDLTKRLVNEEQALNVELEAPTEFKILEEAQILHTQAQMRMALTIAGAALAGLALALLGVGWWEFRRRRIDTVANVADDLGIPVVGALPNSSRRRPRRLHGGHSADAYVDVLLTESIDATRTMLLHLARNESAQVVMVTSATAGEGKTSLACHLAASMARIGLKTLLIDADLRNPTAHRLFEVSNDAGFSELLLGEADIGDVIRPTPVSGLSLLPAGVWDNQVSQFLAQNKARALFDQLRRQYDFILVDSSPVLPVADTLMIGQVVDAVVFSILCEVSRLPSVYVATQRMAALGIRSLGAIVNGVQGELYASTYPYAAGHRGKVEKEVSA